MSGHAETSSDACGQVAASVGDAFETMAHADGKMPSSGSGPKGARLI
jgi:hypothetical protein